MSQVDLFRDAKKVLRRDLSLSDEDVGRACGLGEHVVAALSGSTELGTIRAARREIEQERVLPVDHGGGTGWEPRL